MPQIIGKEIGPIGYGMMGLSWARANPPTLDESIALLKTALENGMNFWNGAEFYGTAEYNSLTIVEKYFEKYPEDADKVVLSIKGVYDPTGKGADGSAEGVRESVDACLKALNGRKSLDIFGPARRDPNTPLEVTLQTLDKEYVQTGKIGGIALSEVKASTIREAAAITKISACEVELSLFSTDVTENGVAAACAEFDIPLVAYSPTSRGLLTGQFKSLDDIPEKSLLRMFPRFQPETFPLNLELAEKVGALAEKRGLTKSQMAINWVSAVARRPGMPTTIPIPGAATAERIVENAKAVELSDAELAELDELFEKFKVAGARYPSFVPTEG